jgi:hypothetical protein
MRYFVVSRSAFGAATLSLVAIVGWLMRNYWRRLRLESLNSQVEFYLDLCMSLILCDPLGTSRRKDLRRDSETLQSRTYAEGLSFLTKTLPKLGKALDLGLMSGSFSIPREFKHSHENGSIPAFMQGYFKLLFDENGVLLAEADPIAVKHLRQVLFFAYKLETPYSKEDEARVIDNFVATDKELEFGRDDNTDRILNTAAEITARIFESFDPKDIDPRHGPGAVATGERLDSKWTFRRLYQGIHQVFPYYDYFIVGKGRELLDRLGWYKSLERLDQGCAKVVLVPKDSRGPRLISCEPLEYQWIQQGLGRKMMSHLEKNFFTRDKVNFTYQRINQRLALEGSLLSNSWSTLDLKDASDRVSLELVRQVFSKTPGLLRALEACRTTETLLPDGNKVALNKFAPMGSALCFPVEAYIFWVLTVSATMPLSKGRIPHWNAVKRVGDQVHVYGDDIIVPEYMALECIQTLETFALKVNHQKCCITGPFKESCGVDAFKGVIVTPLRLRKLWSGRSSDGASLSAYVSLANALSQKGYKETSDLLWARIERVFGAMPYGTQNSPYPCRVIPDADEAERFNIARFKSRWNRNFQRFEFFVSLVKPKRVKSSLEGWPRLARDIITPKEGDPTDMVLPRSIRIKRGWAAV